MSYIKIEVPEYWADDTIEHFCDALYMLGIDIDPQKDVRYSGFWSQGDGASFKGIVNFSNSNIGEYTVRFPSCEVRLGLAKRWEAVASQLQEVALRLDYNGHRYCHENTMTVGEWYADDDLRLKIEKLEDEVLSILRGFAQQLYRQLNDEYDFHLADQTAARYEELAADVKVLEEQVADLESVTDIPAQVAVHLEELQVNRHELIEVLIAQMEQLEFQFYYCTDRKQLTIQEFITQYR